MMYAHENDKCDSAAEGEKHFGSQSGQIYGKPPCELTVQRVVRMFQVSRYNGLKGPDILCVG